MHDQLGKERCTGGATWHSHGPGWSWEASGRYQRFFEALRDRAGREGESEVFCRDKSTATQTQGSTKKTVEYTKDGGGQVRVSYNGVHYGQSYHWKIQMTTMQD